jgi:hypothetical protein
MTVARGSERRLAALFSISVFHGAIAAAQPVTSQPPTVARNVDQGNTWEYGAFVDIAAINAFNNPPNRLFRSRGTTWHVDGIYLDMTGASLKRKPSNESRWGTELLVHTGKDDEIFGFSATAPNIERSEWLRHLGLANVSYLAPAGKGLTVQGGIFSSLIGYDSLYAKDNFNYTRPWGADFTPYLMLGVNASYPVTDTLTATAFVVNGYWHLADANGVPSSGVQLAYRPTSAVTVKQTVLAGPHQTNTSLRFWRWLSDTIVERRSGRIALAAEYHFATEKVDHVAVDRAWWMAAQLPVRWNVRGPWSVAIRPEVAWDSTGRWTLAEQTVAALTSTLEYRLPFKWTNSIVRIEHRVDHSRGPQGGFFAEGPAANGGLRLTPTQHLLLVAALVTFDSPASR